MGHLLWACDFPVATLNLNVNFKKFIKTETEFIVQTNVEKIKDKKLYVHFKATSLDQNTIHGEATALFYRIFDGPAKDAPTRVGF